MENPVSHVKMQIHCRQIFVHVLSRAMMALTLAVTQLAIAYSSLKLDLNREIRRFASHVDQIAKPASTNLSIQRYRTNAQNVMMVTFWMRQFSSASNVTLIVRNAQDQALFAKAAWLEF
jgi:hypothetical protein